MFWVLTYNTYIAFDSWHNYFLYIVYSIDNILLDEAVPNVNFLCDLPKCKGACCTVEGDTGAPLATNEIQELEKALPKAKKYLSQRNLDFIAANGFWEEDAEGDIATKTINNRDCVFVYYDGDIAKCSIEKAYLEDDLEFQKPISCHLFPIRVGEFGGPYLYYEKFDVCKPAIRNGQNQKVKLVEMLREPMIRAYGKETYSKIKELVYHLESVE